MAGGSGRLVTAPRLVEPLQPQPVGGGPLDDDPLPCLAHRAAGRLGIQEPDPTAPVVEVPGEEQRGAGRRRGEQSRGSHIGPDLGGLARRQVPRKRGQVIHRLLAPPVRVLRAVRPVPPRTEGDVPRPPGLLARVRHRDPHLGPVAGDPAPWSGGRDVGRSARWALGPARGRVPLVPGGRPSVGQRLAGRQQPTRRPSGFPLPHRSGYTSAGPTSVRAVRTARDLRTRHGRQGGADEKEDKREPAAGPASAPCTGGNPEATHGPDHYSRMIENHIA